MGIAHMGFKIGEYSGPDLAASGDTVGGRK